MANKVVTLMAKDNQSGVPVRYVDLGGGTEYAQAMVLYGPSGAVVSQLEDSAHTSGDAGSMALAVRRATAPTDLSVGATDGDYEPLQVDGNGRLYTISALRGKNAAEGDTAVLVDASGRTISVGAAAIGAAVAGNPVLVGGKDTSGSSQYVLMDSTGKLAAMVELDLTAAGDNASNGNWSRLVRQNGGVGGLQVAPHSYNAMAAGGGWDRNRNNIDTTLLASASRTTTQTSADLVNYDGVALMVTLDMTVVGTGSVTLTINYKDPASGKYILLLSGVAVITNITTLYRIDPMIAAVATSIAQSRLGRVFQIVATANNANAAQYSVGYTILK